jgi:hypothetical protein
MWGMSDDGWMVDERESPGWGWEIEDRTGGV